MSTRKKLKASDYWRTPPAVVDLAEAMSGWNVVWDVCATEANKVADGHWGEADDALGKHWWGLLERLHRVHFMRRSPAKIALWCNPPFSQVTQWVDKATFEARRGTRILLLTECDPSRSWWWRAAEQSERIFCSENRLRFHNDDGCPDGTGRYGTTIFAMSGRRRALQGSTCVIERFSYRPGRTPKLQHSERPLLPVSSL